MIAVKILVYVLAIAMSMTAKSAIPLVNAAPVAQFHYLFVKD
jgi:hypothetical protein